MKKTLVVLSLLATTLTGWGQSNHGHLIPASSPLLDAMPAKLAGAEKSLLCADTLRYTQAKEQILGTNAFYTFGIWQADAEAFSMTYLLSGASLTINGIEFFGANDATNGTASCTVRASIYSVNGSNVPTTQLATGTVSVSSTTAGYYYVNFGSPITVSGNYAVVLEATNAGGVFNVYVNNATAGQSYDETLARYKSNYYPNSAGSYVSVPVLTTGDATNFSGGPYNFEPLVAPRVSYTITTSSLASPTTICAGSQVTFTGTSGPAGLLTNRFTNYQIFRTYFGLSANDSTHVWDFDDASPLTWLVSGTTHTYSAAGSYDAAYYTLGGFWNSCVDYGTSTITVNAIPAAPTVTPGGPTTFCTGGSVTLTSSAASGNLWSNTANTPSINVTTSGTYTVTQTVAGCTSPASSATVVTVNPLDNASFNYATSTLCTGGSNITPSASMAGTFSSTAGLSFVSTSTGEIDLAGSADGTYVITHTTSGSCPNTATQTITITAAPSADFSYTQMAYCTADVDPSPNFSSGASGGTFSSTTGLVIDGSTGIIDLSASTAGTYTVTNAIAASGSCPAVSDTYSVTVNPSPSASVSGGGSFCGITSTPVMVTLTGSGPWDITYTDGTTPTTVNGVSSSPYTITASASGVYSVTQVTMAGCSASGTGVATVQLNANPTITFSPIAAVCENASLVTLNATPAGGIFSGTGVTGNTFDPAVAGASTTMITYSYTDGNGCSNSATQNAVVNANPTVSLGTFTDMCDYNDAITLSGGLPAGGSYSGNGVSAGMFDPGTAGLGSSTITYSYTDGNGCSNSAASSIMVDECLGLEAEDFSSVTVSPNPTTGEFMISASGNEEITFVVLTEDGKVVVAPRTITNGVSEQVSLSTFAKGVYFVRLSSVSGSSTEKIVLQ
jgi:hypothetical protein